MKIISSFLSIRLKKKNWEEIKKINGKILYKIEGAFKKLSNNGTYKLALVSLKKLTSSNTFKIKIKIKKIEVIYKNDFK